MNSARRFSASHFCFDSLSRKTLFCFKLFFNFENTFFDNCSLQVMHFSARDRLFFTSDSSVDKLFHVERLNLIMATFTYCMNHVTNSTTDNPMGPPFAQNTFHTKVHFARKGLNLLC